MRLGLRCFAYLFAATCVIGCKGEVERDLDRLDRFVDEACACDSRACIDTVFERSLEWSREPERERRMKKAMHDTRTRNRVMADARMLMGCMSKLAPDAKPSMPMFLERPEQASTSDPVAVSPPAKTIEAHCKAGIEAPLDVLCLVGRPVDDVLGRCERMVGGACAVPSAAWFYCEDDAADMVPLSVHSLWTGDDLLKASPDGPAIGATRNVKAEGAASRKKTRDFLDGRLQQLGCKQNDRGAVTTTYRCGERYVELFAGSLPFVSVRAGTARWRAMCAVNR